MPKIHLSGKVTCWTGSTFLVLFSQACSYLTKVTLTCSAFYPGCYPREERPLGHQTKEQFKISESVLRKWISSVQFSQSVVSNSLRPHESQHARPPCPSPTTRVHSNSRPSSQWCQPAISSSVVPFSSCPQSLPASEFFPMSQHFA